MKCIQATKELLADIIHATSHAFRSYFINWPQITSPDTTSGKMNKFVAGFPRGIESIEFKNRYSRPWKSIEFGQNVH